MATSNVELKRAQGEAKAQHIERLREVLQSRRESAQAELELKRHLEATVEAMRRSGAPVHARVELQQQLTKVCIRLGTARGNVEIAEHLLVLALNAD